MPDSRRQVPASKLAAAPRCHREVIDRWPSLKDYAADICVGYETAKQHRKRNSIPDGYRIGAVLGARRRGIAGITYELLTRTAPKRARAKAGAA